MSPDIQITPINPHSLRIAFEHLHHGETIYTGVDRPEESSPLALSFFGRPAYLPLGHVRLAMKTKVPIIVVTATHSSDGLYRARISTPIAMETRADPHTAIIENAQRVLDVLAGYIQRDPGNWLMFYPVWPEALGQMP